MSSSNLTSQNHEVLNFAHLELCCTFGTIFFAHNFRANPNSKNVHFGTVEENELSKLDLG
jgi:hypothetical protein